jgi:hypothetical protein
MDFQNIISNAIIEKMRAEELKNMPILTLGEMIAKMEAIVDKWNKKEKRKNEKEPIVMFDFEYAYPTGLSSWRGVYSELALNFSFCGYGIEGYVKVDGFEAEPPTISEFLNMLKNTVGKTFVGWKGGEFVMGKSTPVWVANDGNGGNTAVVGIKDEGYQVVILTQYISNN